MNNINLCPKCSSENIYEDSNLWICPECGHEWSVYDSKVESAPSQPEEQFVRDAHGNVLHDGDSVTVIKELKIKGSSAVVKVGTKVKNIRLTEGHDGHNIACRIDGVGSIDLKSEYVKKA